MLLDVLVQFSVSIPGAYLSNGHQEGVRCRLRGPMGRQQQGPVPDVPPSAAAAAAHAAAPHRPSLILAAQAAAPVRPWPGPAPHG